MEFASYGAVVFGVSPDCVLSHKKFQEKLNLSVKLLSDPEHQTLEAFGAWGKKKMYGKEYEGVIRSSVIIDPKRFGAVHLAESKSQRSRSGGARLNCTSFWRRKANDSSDARSHANGYKTESPSDGRDGLCRRATPAGLGGAEHSHSLSCPFPGKTSPQRYQSPCTGDRSG